MRTVLIASTLLGSIVGAAPALAQAEPVPTPRDLAGEVAGVGRTLERISRQLDSLLQQRKAELLLKRIELEERRLDPLDREVRSARAGARSVQEEIARMKEMLKQAQQVIDEQLLAGVDPATISEQFTKLHLERELKIQEAALEAVERRVRELEDDLGRGRDRIEILDEQLHEIFEHEDRR